MNMWRLPPLPFPGPPILPGAFLRQKEENGDEEEEEGDIKEVFRSKLESEGHNPELIEMGLKVMMNHLRSPEEAFEIGRNYVREMAK